MRGRRFNAKLNNEPKRNMYNKLNKATYQAIQSELKASKKVVLVDGVAVQPLTYLKAILDPSHSSAKPPRSGLSSQES